MRCFSKFVKRLSRDDLDDAAEHIGGMTVAPQRAGLPRQWQPCDTIRECLVVEWPIEDMPGNIGLLDECAADIVVGDAGGVAQQVGYGRRRFGTTRLSTGLPSSSLASTPTCT